MLKENLLDKAVEFAAHAHAGQVRKGSNLPYIIHPMEVSAICASFTDDVEVLAAAMLHDTVEDTDATVQQIEELFGARVAGIVVGESEDKREGTPASETWKIRKTESIRHIADIEDVAARMVCLGDKLSNIRAIQHDFERIGDELWQRFNQKDPAEHAWYYSTIADVLKDDLGHTEAWHEYRQRVNTVFSSYLSNEQDE